MNQLAQQVFAPIERLHSAPSAPLLPNANSPVVSVIVPTFNCPDHLRFCLGRLAASEYREAEVIVVDDASTDETPELAERLGARVTRLAQNAGPASARNRGAEEARGEVLYFIDADVGVHPQTLGIVAHAFASDAKLDALFGSYDDSPAAPNLVSQYRNLLHHWTHQQASIEAVTFWSGCGAVRRHVFRAHGGFDHQLFVRPATEDIELGMRMAASGRRIRLQKNLQVTHLKCWRIWPMIRTDVWDRAVPWARLIFQRGTLGNDLNMKMSQRISALLAGALVVLLGIGSMFSPLLAVGVLSLILFLFCVDSWTMGRSRWRLVSTVAAAACAAGMAWVVFISATEGGRLQWLLLAAAALTAAIIAINFRFYALLVRAAGPSFALLSIPLHIGYFVYGSVAFAAAMAHCRIIALRSARGTTK